MSPTPATARPAARTAAARQRQGRPRAPALPALDALDRTHRQMMDTLVEMTHLIDHLQDHGVDARAQTEARRICQFFDTHARQHHANEEATVFPPLVRKNDAELTQHVLRLQQDHGWLEEDWLELSPQLKAVAEGYSWYELDGLRHGVGVFTALYREHIALEESLIYPEAKRQMRAEQASRNQRLAGSDKD